MVRRLHLVTGLILFLYLLTHLVNHALGLVSLGTLGSGRQDFLAVWRSLPASVLLYGLLGLHLGLAFRAVYRRRRLSMPAWEAAQLVVSAAVAARAGLGLSAIPGREIELRGLADRLSVRVVANAQALPVAADAPAGA